MEEYHKIQSLFKRDQKGKFTDEWSNPVFEYLKDSYWIWDEKIDGTNIRVNWNGEKVTFGGRTERAQIPVHLLTKLMETFPAEKFKVTDMPPLTLYGEGYGAKIQKGGGNYIQNGVDFCLFDVFIDGFWLQKENINEIATSLKLQVAPLVGGGTLQDAIDFTSMGFKSRWGDFDAEGIVLRPQVQLFDRQGHRVISKLKLKDFSRESK